MERVIHSMANHEPWENYRIIGLSGMESGSLSGIEQETKKRLVKQGSHAHRFIPVNATPSIMRVRKARKTTRTGSRVITHAAMMPP